VAKKKVVRTRRRERKNVVQGQAHIQSTFNNTIISITDIDGNVISWGSAGAQGFKGSRKSTPFAAQQTAEATAKRALEHGMRSIEVFVRGPGAGREAAIVRLHRISGLGTPIRASRGPARRRHAFGNALLLVPPVPSSRRPDRRPIGRLPRAAAHSAAGGH